MKVWELIEKLKQMPSEAAVYICGGCDADCMTGDFDVTMNEDGDVELG